ncbi:winged helix DNA-binding domain-containing protein [Nonomuraea turkmeniaca]|uniref:Winged helix DNA-binding domain-containing protein n=2 Tax=Nonomuraea turkmeniaca TaxID=103838 RepID=A0A5S4EWV3_9ACTN|nr:winged helix DNA-binding domain-containing protein [Nonomuraea turkmeniaca]
MLARQLLLSRAAMPAYDAVEHLVGMQSQAPLAPYVGLWSRLAGFEAAELSRLTAEREVVRVHLMRNTIHLVSARDCLRLHRLFSSVHAREHSSRFARYIKGIDLDELLAAAREVLDERPRTRAELGRVLGERWPGIDPSALAYTVSHLMPVLQVPPRGLWGAGGPAAFASVESWLGRPVDDAPDVDRLVLRYLAAFGPASVSDVQIWSGLTRLREVVDRLGLPLLRDESGQELIDLPDAPRPDPDMPASPRFLPEYDNLLLAYADRSRVIEDGRKVPLPPGGGAATGTLLVDGMWRGTWKITGGVLSIDTFAPLPAADRAAVLAEGHGLVRFAAPEAESHDVVIRGS